MKIFFKNVWLKNLVTKQKARTKFVTRHSNFAISLYLVYSNSMTHVQKKHIKHVHYFERN